MPICSLPREPAGNQAVDHEEIVNRLSPEGFVKLDRSVTLNTSAKDRGFCCRPSGHGSQTGIELSIFRPVGAVPAPFVLDRDRVFTDAGVCACRQRVEQNAVAIGIDIGVDDAEGSAAHDTVKRAHRQAPRPRHFNAAAQREVVPAIGIQRSLAQLEVLLSQNLEVVGGKGCPLLLPRA